MTQVKLEPGASRSQVKHSTTEPLRSLGEFFIKVLHNWELNVVELRCNRAQR